MSYAGETKAPESPSEKETTSTSFETMQEFGQLRLPSTESQLHVMTIVGQIEGHMILPPQNKTTKYEHNTPQ